MQDEPGLTDVPVVPAGRTGPALATVSKRAALRGDTLVPYLRRVLGEPPLAEADGTPQSGLSLELR